MRQIVVPDELRRSATTVFAASGAAWADALPDLVDEFVAEWSLGARPAG